jgi:hypothetical protein
VVNMVVPELVNRKVKIGRAQLPRQLGQRKDRLPRQAYNRIAMRANGMASIEP